MTVEMIGTVLTLVLALNVGANNAGVHMAPAFGAGVRGKWSSLLLFALFAGAGALLLGRHPLKMVGQDLFSRGFDGEAWLFLILAPSITIVFLGAANYFKLPMPTTPLAVCCLAGVGLAHHMVNVRKFGEIILWWVASPVVTLIVGWLAGKLLVRAAPSLMHPERLSPRARRWMGWLLTFEGCYSAFAIGANSVGNTMAPLYGAGVFPLITCLVLAGIGFGIGALLWGGRVLETVGKGITELCHVRALVVGLAAATALIIASQFGCPISGAFVVTSGVIGFSMATEGTRSTAGKQSVRRILFAWTAGPTLAILTAYLIVAIVR